jgi:putative transcriptional regulator
VDEQLIRFRIRLGLRIRQLRLLIELEQSALASILNRDKQFINRYELEGANPTADIIVKLVKALETTFDKLFDFSQIKEAEVEEIFKKLQLKSRERNSLK